MVVYAFAVDEPLDAQYAADLGVHWIGTDHPGPALTWLGRGESGFDAGEVLATTSPRDPGERWRAVPAGIDPDGRLAVQALAKFDRPLTPELVEQLLDEEASAKEAVRQTLADARAWPRLTGAEQRALIDNCSEFIGTGGFPPPARYEANSVTLERSRTYRDKLRSQQRGGKKLSAAQRRFAAKMDRVDEELLKTTQAASEAGIAAPHIWAFDRHLRFVLSGANPLTAPTVSLLAHRRGQLPHVDDFPAVVLDQLRSDRESAWITWSAPDREPARRAIARRVRLGESALYRDLAVLNALRQASAPEGRNPTIPRVHWAPDPSTDSDLRKLARSRIAILQTPEGDTSVVGHRGTPHLRPESTLAGYELALDQGADGIEGDIQPTGQGGLVVAHDKTLGRTAGVAGRFDEHSVAQLELFDFGAWHWSARLGDAQGDTGLLLWADLLRFASDYPRAVLVVIEHKGGDVEDELVRLLQSLHMDSAASAQKARVVVISRNPNTLRRVRWLAPNVPTSLIWGSGREAIAMAKRRGAWAITVNIKELSANPSLVATAAAEGLAVICAGRTTNLAEVRAGRAYIGLGDTLRGDAEYCQSLGVAAMTVNNPGQVVSWLQPGGLPGEAGQAGINGLGDSGPGGPSGPRALRDGDPCPVEDQFEARPPVGNAIENPQPGDAERRIVEMASQTFGRAIHLGPGPVTSREVVEAFGFDLELASYAEVEDTLGYLRRGSSAIVWSFRAYGSGLDVRWGINDGEEIRCYNPVSDRFTDWPALRDHQTSRAAVGYLDAHGDPLRPFDEHDGRWDTASEQMNAAQAALSGAEMAQLADETEALNADFAWAMDRVAPGSDEANGLAERDLAIRRRLFAEFDYGLHRNFGRRLVTDGSLRSPYERIAPRLARYVRDVIVANAKRHLGRMPVGGGDGASHNGDEIGVREDRGDGAVSGHDDGPPAGEQSEPADASLIAATRLAPDGSQADGKHVAAEDKSQDVGDTQARDPEWVRRFGLPLPASDRAGCLVRAPEYLWQLGGAQWPLQRGENDWETAQLTAGGRFKPVNPRGPPRGRRDRDPFAASAAPVRAAAAGLLRLSRRARADAAWVVLHTDDERDDHLVMLQVIGSEVVVFDEAVGGPMGFREWETIQPFGQVDAAWQLLLHTEPGTGKLHAIHRLDKHPPTSGLPTHKNIRGAAGSPETPGLGASEASDPPAGLPDVFRTGGLDEIASWLWQRYRVNFEMADSDFDEDFVRGVATIVAETFADFPGMALTNISARQLAQPHLGQVRLGQAKRVDLVRRAAIDIGAVIASVTPFEVAAHFIADRGVQVGLQAGVISAVVNRAVRGLRPVRVVWRARRRAGGGPVSRYVSRIELNRDLLFAESKAREMEIDCQERGFSRGAREPAADTMLHEIAYVVWRTGGYRAAADVMPALWDHYVEHYSVRDVDSNTELADFWLWFKAQFSGYSVDAFKDLMAKNADPRRMSRVMRREWLLDELFAESFVAVRNPQIQATRGELIVYRTVAEWFRRNVPATPASVVAEVPEPADVSQRYGLCGLYELWFIRNRYDGDTVVQTPFDVFGEDAVSIVEVLTSYGFGSRELSQFAHGRWEAGSPWSFAARVRNDKDEARHVLVTVRYPGPGGLGVFDGSAFTLTATDDGELWLHEWMPVSHDSGSVSFDEHDAYGAGAERRLRELTALGVQFAGIVIDGEGRAERPLHEADKIDWEREEGVAGRIGGAGGRSDGDGGGAGDGAAGPRGGGVGDRGGDGDAGDDEGRLFDELEQALGAAGNGQGGFKDGSARSAVDDDDIQRRFALHALSRLPERESGYPLGSVGWVHEQLLPAEFSSRITLLDGLDGFIADGQEQAATIADWWEGLTDESLPPALLELVDHIPGELPEPAPTGLSKLQTAVYASYWPFFPRALGIPPSVATAACRYLMTRAADPETYAQLDIDVATHLNAVAMNEGTRERDGAEIIPDDLTVGSRFVDIYSGSAVFTYGDVKHADRRIYVVMPHDGPPSAEDYRRMNRIGVGLLGETREFVKRMPESDQAAAPRIAVVCVLQRTRQRDEVRGLFLLRNTAVDAALGPGEFPMVALGNASTAALFATRGERMAAAGLRKLVVVDLAQPIDATWATGVDVEVLQITSATGTGETDDAQGSSAGVFRQDLLPGASWIHGIDGAPRADLLRADQSSLMRRVLARIVLGLDISAYMPGLEVYGRRMPDLQGRCLSVGNEFQLAAGVDGFGLPADAVEWWLLEQTTRGRLEPVTLEEGGGVALVERAVAGIRMRRTVNAQGIVEKQRPPLDSMILVVDDGADAHRVDLFYEETTETTWVADLLVGGPLEYERWLEVQPYRTVQQAWIIGFSSDSKGELKPVNGELHDPHQAHPDMPSRPIRGAPRGPRTLRTEDPSPQDQRGEIAAAEQALMAVAALELLKVRLKASRLTDDEIPEALAAAYPSPAGTSAPSPHLLEDIATLTRREQEFLALRGLGLSNADVSRRMEVSRRTVSRYKTGAAETLEALWQARLRPPPDPPQGESGQPGEGASKPGDPKVEPLRWVDDDEAWRFILSGFDPRAVRGPGVDVARQPGTSDKGDVHTPVGFPRNPLIGAPVEGDTFGEWLARYQRSVDMSVGELAAAAHMSSNYLPRIIAGKRHPSLPTVRTLLDALNIHGRLRVEVMRSAYAIFGFLGLDDLLSELASAALEGRTVGRAAVRRELPGVVDRLQQQYGDEMRGWVVERLGAAVADPAPVVDAVFAAARAGAVETANMTVRAWLRQTTHFVIYRARLAELAREGLAGSRPSAGIDPHEAVGALRRATARSLDDVVVQSDAGSELVALIKENVSAAAAARRLGDTWTAERVRQEWCVVAAAAARALFDPTMYLEPYQKWLLDLQRQGRTVEEIADRLIGHGVAIEARQVKADLQRAHTRQKKLFEGARPLSPHACNLARLREVDGRPEFVRAVDGLEPHRFRFFTRYWSGLPAWAIAQPVGVAGRISKLVAHTIVSELVALVEGAEPTTLGAALARIRAAIWADRPELYQLTRPQRQCLLDYLDDQRAEDTAARLQISAAQVRVHHAEAIVRLNAWLCGARATPLDVDLGVIHHAEQNRPDDFAAAMDEFTAEQQGLIRLVLDGREDPDDPVPTVMGDLARTLVGADGDGAAHEAGRASQRVLDCLPKAFAAVRELGADPETVVLEDAFSPQQVMARLLEPDDQADTAIIVVDNGRRAHAYAVTVLAAPGQVPTQADVLVSDPLFAHQWRRGSDPYWLQRYDVAQTFVAYYTRVGDALEPARPVPLGDRSWARVPHPITGPPEGKPAGLSLTLEHGDEAGVGVVRRQMIGWLGGLGWLGESQIQWMKLVVTELVTNAAIKHGEGPVQVTATAGHVSGQQMLRMTFVDASRGVPILADTGALTEATFEDIDEFDELSAQGGRGTRIMREALEDEDLHLAWGYTLEDAGTTVQKTVYVELFKTMLTDRVPMLAPDRGISRPWAGKMYAHVSAIRELALQHGWSPQDARRDCADALKAVSALRRANDLDRAHPAQIIVEVLDDESGRWLRVTVVDDDHDLPDLPDAERLERYQRVGVDLDPRGRRISFDTPRRGGGGADTDHARSPPGSDHTDDAPGSFPPARPRNGENDQTVGPITGPPQADGVGDSSAGEPGAEPTTREPRRADWFFDKFERSSGPTIRAEDVAGRIGRQWQPPSDGEPPTSESEELEALQLDAANLAVVLHRRLVELIGELSPEAEDDLGHELPLEFLAKAALYGSARASNRVGEFADLVARYLVAEEEARIFEERVEWLWALEAPELPADPRDRVVEPPLPAQREALVRAFAGLRDGYAVDVAQLPVDAIKGALLDVLRDGFLWYDPDLARELIENTVRCRMADICARWSGDEGSAARPDGSAAIPIRREPALVEVVHPAAAMVWVFEPGAAAPTRFGASTSASSRGVRHGLITSFIHHELGATAPESVARVLRDAVTSAAFVAELGGSVVSAAVDVSEDYPWVQLVVSLAGLDPYSAAAAASRVRVLDAAADAVQARRVLDKLVADPEFIGLPVATVVVVRLGASGRADPASRQRQVEALANQIRGLRRTGSRDAACWIESGEAESLELVERVMALPRFATPTRVHGALVTPLSTAAPPRMGEFDRGRRELGRCLTRLRRWAEDDLRLLWQELQALADELGVADRLLRGSWDAEAYVALLRECGELESRLEELFDDFPESLLRDLEAVSDRSEAEEEALFLCRRISQLYSLWACVEQIKWEGARRDSLAGLAALLSRSSEHDELHDKVRLLEECAGREIVLRGQLDSVAEQLGLPSLRGRGAYEWLRAEVYTAGEEAMKMLRQELTATVPHPVAIAAAAQRLYRFKATEPVCEARVAEVRELQHYIAGRLGDGEQVVPPAPRQPAPADGSAATPLGQLGPLIELTGSSVRGVDGASHPGNPGLGGSQTAPEQSFAGVQRGVALKAAAARWYVPDVIAGAAASDLLAWVVPDDAMVTGLLGPLNELIYAANELAQTGQCPIRIPDEDTIGTWAFMGVSPRQLAWYAGSEWTATRPVEVARLIRGRRLPAQLAVLTVAWRRGDRAGEFVEFSDDDGRLVVGHTLTVTAHGAELIVHELAHVRVGDRNAWSREYRGGVAWRRLRELESLYPTASALIYRRDGTAQRPLRRADDPQHVEPQDSASELPPAPPGSAPAGGEPREAADEGDSTGPAESQQDSGNGHEGAPPVRSPDTAGGGAGGGGGDLAGTPLGPAEPGDTNEPERERAKRAAGVARNLVDQAQNNLVEWMRSMPIDVMHGLRIDLDKAASTPQTLLAVLVREDVRAAMCKGDQELSAMLATQLAGYLIDIATVSVYEQLEADLAKEPFTAPAVDPIGELRDRHQATQIWISRLEDDLKHLLAAGSRVLAKAGVEPWLATEIWETAPMVGVWPLLLQGLVWHDSKLAEKLANTYVRMQAAQLRVSILAQALEEVPGDQDESLTVLESMVGDDAAARRFAVDMPLAELVSSASPLVCTARQLAFGRWHFSEVRGIKTWITVPDIDTIHVAALPKWGFTAAEFAYHARGHEPLGLQAAPADGGWVDNPDVAELVTRLLDGTDPTDLVWLATSPSEPKEHGHVWTLTTPDPQDSRFEQGQLQLHVVIADPDPFDPDQPARALTGRYRTKEYDSGCSNAAEVLSHLRRKPGTTLHAIVVDRDGNAQPATGKGPKRTLGHHPPAEFGSTNQPRGHLGDVPPQPPGGESAGLSSGDPAASARPVDIARAPDGEIEGLPSR